MGSKRNRAGKVVSGRGAQLTDIQKEFLERVKVEGIHNQAKISKDLNYTSYYRDKANYGTAFHSELQRVVAQSAERVEAAKGANLDVLIKMRDEALIEGNPRVVLECIKIINEMQGYKAPTKVQQTKIDVKATIDLTKQPDEDDLYLDVDYEDED